MHDYNLSTKNIVFNQINGRGIQINKYRDGGKNRATTSHASANPSLTNGQAMHNTNYHNFGATNSNQLRLFNLNYKQALGKRENINQVIKDCFITKKFGVKHAGPPNSQQAPSKQKALYESQPPAKKRSNMNSEQSKKSKV